MSLLMEGGEQLSLCMSKCPPDVRRRTTHSELFKCAGSMPPTLATSAAAAAGARHCRRDLTGKIGRLRSVCDSAFGLVVFDCDVLGQLFQTWPVLLGQVYVRRYLEQIPSMRTPHRASST